MLLPARAAVRFRANRGDSLRVLLAIVISILVGGGMGLLAGACSDDGGAGEVLSERP
jgi:hypothetical protein